MITIITTRKLTLTSTSYLYSTTTELPLDYYGSAKSYILILDFRDTFFQANPFESFGAVESRYG